MANIDRLKIVFSILKEIGDGNIPTRKDYGIEKQQFDDIVEAISIDGLLEGVALNHGKGNRVIRAGLENARLTIKGMEYLHENSTLMKTYKGLKEVRDWIPFIY